MKHSISTSIEIKATPEKVWQVLTDFEAYPNWNPFIKSISGEKVVGQKLLVHIQPPNRKLMTFKPKVLKFDPNSELRWFGTGPIKGLFDGEHYFRITQKENGIVNFEHGENFRGLLVGLMPQVLKDTKVGFELMNEGLKKECE